MLKKLKNIYRSISLDKYEKNFINKFNNEIDIAVLLTEGIVTDIINGNQSKIVHTYVQSPLIWGVHVPYNSNFHSVKDLENQRIAISRYNSGSHLMSYLLHA